jgi:hypothetical protein
MRFHKYCFSRMHLYRQWMYFLMIAFSIQDVPYYHLILILYILISFNLHILVFYEYLILNNFNYVVLLLHFLFLINLIRT